MKPDVIAQTIKLEKERAKMAEDAAAAAANGGGGGTGGQIILQQPGQQPVALNNQQVVQIIQQLQTDVDQRNKELAELKEKHRIRKAKHHLLSESKMTMPEVPTPPVIQSETIYM